MVDIVTIALIGSLNYAIFGLAGLVANVVLLIALSRLRKKSSTFNKTLASLAIINIISDVFFTTIGTVFSYGILANNLSFRVFLKMITLFQINKGFVMVALSHIVFIAIQRFVAVHFPLHFKRIFTTKVTWLLMILTWLLPTVLFLLFLFIGIYLEEDSKVSYLMLLFGFILIICYISMLISLTIQRQKCKQLRRSSNATFGANHNWKLLFNSIGVTCLFLVFIYPYAISSIRGEGFTRRYLFSSFIAIRTLIDPLVYFFITLCGVYFKSSKRQTANRRISPAVLRGSDSGIVKAGKPTTMEKTSI